MSLHKIKFLKAPRKVSYVFVRPHEMRPGQLKRFYKVFNDRLVPEDLNARPKIKVRVDVLPKMMHFCKPSNR